MDIIEKEKLKLTLDDDLTEVLVENNAQAIFDHLAVLEKQRELHAKRWFWELLQNAKDAVEQHEFVRVRVRLLGNVLTFSHTGNPFFRKDILHVILHGSSKKSLEGKTGRFGTGFMTTNLLSMAVTVTGKLIDGYYFKFLLDRGATDPKEEERKLIESYHRFGDSLQLEPSSADEYETHFQFELEGEGLTTAEEGLAQLTTILPVVLAFNSKITEICVDNNGDEFFIKRTDSPVREEKAGTLTLRIREYSVSKTAQLKVCIFDNEESQIAMLLHEQDGKQEVMRLGNDYPRLFFDFPLFGTEDIGFPVIINSKGFDPRMERDGIYLGKEEKPEILANKRILKQALENVIDIIGFASQEQYQHLYHLYAYEPSVNYPWLHADWLVGVYQDLVNKYLQAQVIQVSPTLSRVSLNDLKIPLSASDDGASFHLLVSQLYPSHTPGLHEAGEWLSVLKDYQAIQQLPLESYSGIINDDKLGLDLQTNVRHISKLGTMLAPIDAIDWLKRFYGHLDEEAFRTLILKYSIIPNELGDLVKKTTQTPFIDHVDDDDLKVIAEGHGWEIRKELIYPDLSFKKEDFQVMNPARILRSLDTIMATVTSEQLDQGPKRRAFMNHLKWLIKNGYDGELREMPVLIYDRTESTSNQGYGKRKLFTANSERLLAPLSTWKAEFGIYDSLIRAKLVLIDEYADVLNETDLRYLSDLGLIYLRPLLAQKKKAGRNEVKMLLQDIAQLSLLEQNGELKEFEIEYSDIPYLNTDEILAKTQSASRSAKNLLSFILNEVLPNDPFAGKQQKLIIEGTPVILNQQMWISRLRNSRWVPVRTIETEEPDTDHATANNITPLLIGETAILERLKDRNAAIFFNKLGISVADILRNTIGSAEKKLLWDLTFSSLITNKVDPELAVAMLEDKGLQDEYLRKKKEKETIANNQKTGYKFEEIFRKMFLQERYKQKGIKIVRRARGSDFDIVADMDYLDENGKEIVLQLGNLIIELKATGKPYAEMTTTQAKDAVTYHNNYVLVVLPLAGYDIDEPGIRANARFVTNIGDILEGNYKDFNEYVAKKDIASLEKENVKLSIEEGKIRYQVKQNTWRPSASNEHSHSFDEFESYLFENKISSVEYK